MRLENKDMWLNIIIGNKFYNDIMNIIVIYNKTEIF